MPPESWSMQRRVVKELVCFCEYDDPGSDEIEDVYVDVEPVQRAYDYTKHQHMHQPLHELMCARQCTRTTNQQLSGFWNIGRWLGYRVLVHNTLIWLLMAFHDTTNTTKYVTNIEKQYSKKKCCSVPCRRFRNNQVSHSEALSVALVDAVISACVGSLCNRKLTLNCCKNE